MRTLLLLLALVAQQSDVDSVDQLQYEKYAAEGATPFDDMITIQAVHFEDGTPARGTIACNGWWRKFDETQQGDYNLPFKTDSRGVIVMNPWIGQYRYGPMICSALDVHGHTGTGAVKMPTNRMLIQVR